MPKIVPPPTPLTESQRSMILLHLDLATRVGRKLARRWPRLVNEIESAATMGLIEVATRYEGPWTTTYVEALVIEHVRWRVRDAIRQSRPRRGCNIPDGGTAPHVCSLSQKTEDGGHCRRVLGHPTPADHPTLDDDDSFQYRIHTCDDQCHRLLEFMFHDGLTQRQAARKVGCLRKSTASGLYRRALGQAVGGCVVSQRR